MSLSLLFSSVSSLYIWYIFDLVDRNCETVQIKSHNISFIQGRQPLCTRQVWDRKCRILWIRSRWSQMVSFFFFYLLMLLTNLTYRKQETQVMINLNFLHMFLDLVWKQETHCWSFGYTRFHHLVKESSSNKC